MSVARGTKYLEETRVREREIQRARTEARQVQLKLTELEARITDLEGLREGFAGKATARCLSVSSACLGTSLLLLLVLGHLTTGAPHCNVRNDFVDTSDGIKPRVQLPVNDVVDSLYW